MFIGRHYELQKLAEHHGSDRTELVLLYGRRRIGKTELIKEFSKRRRCLYFEALEDVSKKEQIDHFLIQLAQQIHQPKYACSSWRQAFDVLSDLIAKKEWIVVFDEFPWMASKRTSLVSLIKFYWDQKWKRNPKLMLILCGSVASFMVRHVVHSRALHNRKTLEMRLTHLRPNEVRLFFKNRSLREVAQIMMTVGGVPKYLEMFSSRCSAKINFNRQFFQKDGFFIHEFETLFKEQFQTLKYYESIVRALSQKDSNLTELSQILSFPSGGSLKKYLENLEIAGFVEEMASLSLKGFKERTKKYRLADPFLRVYFRFIKPNKNRIQMNTKANLVDAIMEPLWEVFFGQAFDWFVYQSVERILEILEIPLADLLEYGPFFQQRSRTKHSQSGAQVDLLFVRRDHCLTVIENKFTKDPVGSWILDEMQKKIDRLAIPKSYSLEKVLISAEGATKGVLASRYFNKIITLEELFG